jgi:hypothetical protein
LKRLLDRGLSATARRWPAIRRAYGWVHQAAAILGSEEGDGRSIRRRLRGLLGAMARHRHTVGRLATGVSHFLKVSRSYWPGLFACYTVPDLPRTNNALEQMFGSYRYHERRSSGRKGASPALVLRGAARMIAAVATRQRVFTATDLAQANRPAWSQLRQTLEERRHRRVQRRRFRCNPECYLRRLEEQLIQLTLPA